MKATLTRKQFLGITCVTALGAGLGGLQFFRRSQIRIKPIKGKKYSPSFLAFCKRARFHSVKEAVKCVKDQTSEFQVVVET